MITILLSLYIYNDASDLFVCASDFRKKRQRVDYGATAVLLSVCLYSSICEHNEKVKGKLSYSSTA